MKLDVPFFKQTTHLNCGQIALKMVLAYFDKDEEIQTLESKTGIEEGVGISTIQIAIASALSGFNTKLYSKNILFNEENLKLDFYKKYSNINLENSKKLFKRAIEVGVNIKEKTLTLEEILKVITKDSVPIILLDWNIVKPRRDKGYHGHFVPIVGYDKQNIYIHNPGFHNTKAFMPISKNIFNEARKAKGTDEDIVIIYRG